MRRCLFCVVSLALSLSLTACGDDQEEDGHAGDTGTDVVDTTSDTGALDTSGADASDADGSDAGFDPLERTPVQDGVDPEGHSDVAEDLTPGEVRVGKISSTDTGFTGTWSHCRQGDYKLYNSEVAVCIQSESTNRFELFSGGKLVDAIRVGTSGSSRDRLDALSPLIGFNTLFAESVEVVRDGSEGDLAVIRVEGRDEPIAHLSGVLPGQLFGGSKGLDVTHEYRLRADSNTVEIVTWYGYDGQGSRSFDAGDFFAWGERGRLWSPTEGFGDAGNEFGWVAGIGEGFSHAWVAPGTGSNLGLPADQLPWVGAESKEVELQPGSEDVARRWLVIGDGSLASLRRRAAELRGESIPGSERSVEVTDSSGEPVRQHWVTVYDGETPVTAGLTDANGVVDLILPGRELTFEVEGWPTSSPSTFTEQVGGSNLSLELPQPGQIDLRVEDADTQVGTTAFVEVRGGESGWSGVASRGDLLLDVPPGSYQLAVRHGHEYDGRLIDVDVEAGQATEVTAQLEHSVDTDGWISADFHQHMEPSVDSDASLEDRVRENVAMGVEFAVPTDHEAVTDLGPIVEDLGFEQQIGTFPGVEISPIEAHIGFYPMTYDPTLRGFGTVPLAVMGDDGPVRRSLPELAAEARTLESDPIVQMNHARRDTSGMLELVNFDPTAGPEAVSDSRFVSDFDTMEIINEYGSNCRLFRDWAGFLNYGHVATGLGNSDEHGLSGDSGRARNFLMIDKAVADVTESDIRQALREHRVTVGSNGFIDFSDVTSPGDVIDAQSGDPVELSVRVQTPDWASATELVAVVNGTETATFTASDDPARIVDFDETVSFDPSGDAWVVFFGYGPQPSGALSSGRPTVVFTNPVFIDTDGDADADGSAWEAPGLGPITVPTIDQLCQ